MGKTQDKKFADAINKQFNLKKIGQGFEIDSVKDQAMKFSTQLLSSKLLRKGHHNEVVVHFIELGSHCAQGTIYNWVAFIQNEFVEDCREAQEKGTLFHYAWLLILIALESWRALTGARFPKVASHDCRTIRYMNLAWIKNRQRQLITDHIFRGYFEQIVETISKIPRVPVDIIDEYRL